MFIPKKSNIYFRNFAKQLHLRSIIKTKNIHMTEDNNKHEGLEGKIESVENVLSRTEHYIEENQKSLTIIVLAVVGVIALYFAFNRFYLKPLEERAQSQMFMAERYFESDSLNKALNGDGNYPGFLGIIDEFGLTKSANLAHYYAGVCYKNMGKYDDAIEHLEKFSGSDRVLSSVALGSIGDCYAEKGDVEKAVKYYKKAADNVKSDFTTPVYLMRAGILLESKNEFAKAIELYQRVLTEYNKTQEGQQAQKYIDRAKAKGNI
jgi:tetratricopeptide (TPR) repeat protein